MREPMDFEERPRPAEKDGSGSSFLLDWMGGVAESGHRLASYPQDKLDTETLSRARTTIWGKFEKGSQIELC